jgi:lysophospholipase L1-like esterase
MHCRLLTLLLIVSCVSAAARAQLVEDFSLPRPANCCLAGAAARLDGFLRADDTNDGLHPNAAGYALMAPVAAAAIAKTLR